MTLAYAELRRMASGYLSKERPGLTLQPTALVHEAYLRLVQDGALHFVDRTHFLAIAAKVMRQILVDGARIKSAAKRTAPAFVPTLHNPAFAGAEVRILALDEALDRLKSVDAGQAEIVEMRFFAGMTAAEVADRLGISLRTVNREWATARAWLRRDLRRAGL